MISVRAASLVYQDHGRPVYACRDIDLDVEDGEYLGILGPSGSGKSSLLYLMSGLKTPTHGS
ncbi:MAG: ATP-binding cassette domain-containing protein, partial [Fimbriimonadaceae bacterium]|nr:ATP-binding cassette domain-containing protein [Fimbriimonadaceae bacterium]